MIQFESSEAGNTAPEMEEWKTAGIPTMKPGLVYHDVEIAGRSQSPRSALTLGDARGEEDSLSSGVAQICHQTPSALVAQSLLSAGTFWSPRLTSQNSRVTFAASSSL